MRTLSTAAEVIEALDGPTATGRLVGRSVQSVVNWRAANRLPADTYLILNAALEERGYTAPGSLWNMVEAVQ